MLPKCLQQVISRLYIPYPSELSHFDPRSSLQIEEYFQYEISEAKKECMLYPRLQKHNYYVLLGEEDNDIDLIHGTHLISFSVTLPSYKELTKITASSVPRQDVIAFSVELEALFDHEVKVAQIKVWEYIRRLRCIHEPASITKKTILALIHKVYEKKVFSGWRAMIAPKEELRTLHSLAVKEYDAQLAALNKFLHIKDSL
jgi:hypothetical protein